MLVHKFRNFNNKLQKRKLILKTHIKKSNFLISKELLP